MDKLPEIQARDYQYEPTASRIDAKALAREIERKEKLRSQRESLKHIYLGK